MGGRCVRIEEGNRANQPFIRSEQIQAVIGGTTAAQFRTALELAYTENHPVDIEAMLERIDDAGRELVTRRGVEELKAYREAVRDFLKEAIGSTYQMKQEQHWDRRGNSRDYRLIIKVNHNLDELTRLVLQTQAPSIELMAKLDEIRGLLVDLKF